MYSNNYNIGFQKQLYVTDLDGTLFNNRGEISQYSADIINKVIEMGIRFTFATGKSYQTVASQISKLNLNMPCITYDGACINECNGKLLKCYEIQKATLKRIIKYVYDKSSSFLVYSLVNNKECIFWTREKTNTYTKMYFDNRPADKRFCETSNIKQLSQGQVLFVAFIDCLENIKNIEKYLTDIGITNIQINRDAYIKNMYWLKVKHPNANKGDAVSFIQNNEKCNHVVSFGNDSNDLDMFRVSDVSICVSNSSDDLKVISTKIIKSNEEDGIAEYLSESLTYEMACG